MELNDELSELRMERKVAILRSKKVVGLTITGREAMAGYPAVLRTRDVYPGSRIRLFSSPDPNCLHPGSAAKNLIRVVLPGSGC